METWKRISYISVILILLLFVVNLYNQNRFLERQNNLLHRNFDEIASRIEILESEMRAGKVFAVAMLPGVMPKKHGMGTVEQEAEYSPIVSSTPTPTKKSSEPKAAGNKGYLFRYGKPTM